MSTSLRSLLSSLHSSTRAQPNIIEPTTTGKWFRFWDLFMVLLQWKTRKMCWMAVIGIILVWYHIPRLYSYHSLSRRLQSPLYNSDVLSVSKNWICFPWSTLDQKCGWLSIFEVEIMLSTFSCQNSKLKALSQVLLAFIVLCLEWDNHLHNGNTTNRLLNSRRKSWAYPWPMRSNGLQNLKMCLWISKECEVLVEEISRSWSHLGIFQNHTTMISYFPTLWIMYHCT